VTDPFPYRLAAVDLDDTLLGPDKTISPANQEAVQSLQARGVRVVLASGRRHSNILRFHEQLGLGSDDPIVSCNGALVQTARTGRVLLRHPLPAPFAREVLAEGARRKMTQNYYHPDGNIYIRERTPWVALYEERTGSRDLIVWGDLSSLLVGDAGPQQRPRSRSSGWTTPRASPICSARWPSALPCPAICTSPSPTRNIWSSWTRP
jgi:hypothetical protein